MEQKTIPIRTRVIDGKTVIEERIVEKTPCEFLNALESAQTPYEVHVYDDSTSIGLDLVGDAVEFSGDFLDDYPGDNPPYSTLLWDYRYAFIDAYRKKVEEEKED